MQKAVFIKALSEKLKLSEEIISPVVDATFQTLSSALSEGYRIEIRGFGVFSVRLREAHEGRNPQSGERVSVPSAYTPHFRLSREIQRNFS
jgi:nucleoid DNA-binding protein